jgi:hypothetical protein
MEYFAGSGSSTTTDLFALFNSVQNTQIAYPKELIIATLRDVFSVDTTYHYVRDPWGFPFTPNLTDVSPDAGLHDDKTSRVWIGQNFRKDVIYYPAVVVRSGGSVSEELSINKERDTVLYGTTLVSDGYGNFKQFITPIAMVFAGIWNGTINIDVYSAGVRELDDIIEIVSTTFETWRFDELLRAGVLVKRISVGSPSETDDRNSKLFKVTISLDIRSEWRRHIPVENVVDAINICVEIGHTNLKTQQFVEDPNLEIHTYVNILEAIQSL